MNGLPVNVADLLILGVILVSGLFALVRGFVHELLSLGAWIGAGVVTFYGFDHVAPLARQLTTIQPLADLGAGTLLFLVVLIILTVLTRILVRRVRDSSLGPLDRSLGLLFGLVRGGVLVAVIWLVAAWSFQDEPLPDWIAEARTLPLVQAGSRTLYELLPDGLRPAEMPAALAPEEGDGPITFEDLGAPATKGTGPEDRSGYNDEERKRLQGLIEQSQ